jgi:predicted CoA-binding protein
MDNGRLWLCVDSAIKKLTSANYWVTSIDPYKQDLEQAIKSLKEVREKIETENENKNKKTTP